MTEEQASPRWNFLLELYKQANEHLRECDRRRDLLLGTYLGFVAMGVGGFVTILRLIGESNPPWFAWFIMVALLLLGMPIIRTVVVFRAWHAFYVNISKAVQKSVAEGNLNLYEMACSLINDKDNRYNYFSPRGVEFAMYLLVLLIGGVILSALIYMTLSYNLLFYTWSASIVSVVALAATLLLGVYCYRRYLNHQQSQFPRCSWMVIQPPAA